MVSFVLVLAIVTMVAAPDTPAARLFRRYLVEKPVDVLARIERRHLILAGIILFLCTLGGEIFMVLGSWDMAMFWAVDTSILVDAVIAAWTIATVTRGRRVWTAIVAQRSSIRPRSRARRTRVADRTRPPSANDDDQPASFAVAA